tara:strand:- start:1216 stop:1407 length:192 start_codon:yes stop_codon:yes gene_type:complete
MSEQIDLDQNKRIGRLEERLNEVENNISAITAKLDVIQQLCKGLMLLAGVALGVDVVPMMGGM